MGNAFNCDSCNELKSGTSSGVVTIGYTTIIPPMSDRKFQSNEYELCEECSKEIENQIKN